jgi:hypothetical protein
MSIYPYTCICVELSSVGYYFSVDEKRTAITRKHGDSREIDDAVDRPVI